MKRSDGDVDPPRPRKRPGRVPVSCAECRRLKMRCDRNHPCENCKKRGCAAICPDGTLTTGKHNRMILANTEELHDKIEDLLDRIRVLEDALRSLQASVSTQPHPLLAHLPTDAQPPSPALRLPSPRQEPEEQDNSEANQLNEVPLTPEADDISSLDALGTLSIGAEGETNYLGQSARADYLFHESDSEDLIKLGRLPKCFYGYTWPEPLPPDESLEQTILSFLPDLAEAKSICEVYLRYTTWLPLFISRQTLEDELLAHIYHLCNTRWADIRTTCPHRLSLLFAILAIGALFDPSRAQMPDADDYYHLSRVALALKSAVTETTVNAVSAILHIAFYLEHCESTQGHEKSWLLLGVASKLSLSMGLHRDSSYWKLDPVTMQRRHETFWQLYVMDSISSLQFGRPPTIPEEFIDCPLPTASGSSRTDLDESSYNIWILRFSRTIRKVLTEVFSVRNPSYVAVLGLEHEIRNFPEPWAGKDNPHSFPRASLQRWIVMVFKEAVLLHLHRNFFIEAISDLGRTSIKSKYSPSVNTCYESSRRLIDGLSWINNQAPEAVVRMSSWFGVAMTSASVMCLLVAKFPQSEYVRPALDCMERMQTLFRSAASSNHVARKNLDMITQLQAIARGALDLNRVYVPRGVSHAPGDISQPPLLSVVDAQILQRTFGQTRRRSRRVPICRPRTGLGIPHGCMVHHPPIEERRIHETHSAWMSNTSSLISPATSTPTSSTSAPGSSSCSVDFSRGYAGFPAEASGPVYASMPNSTMVSADPAWCNFLQQVGF